jgi:hypothetical protein
LNHLNRKEEELSEMKAFFLPQIFFSEKFGDSKTLLTFEVSNKNKPTKKSKS